MVKRKWLWGKKSSEKVACETESLGSMSSQSEKLLEDQDASKGSPSNTQSPEVMSKGTECEISGEASNDSIKSLTRTLSDATIGDGSKDSLTKENPPNISVDKDTQKLSDAEVDCVTEDCLLKENVSKISVDKTQLEQVALETSSNCKEDNGNLKLLTEKLSAALVNVSLKDDLVKQHSRVAEEAVAGWEKAENEVGTLKQQLETVVQQKTAMEGRVSHLDQALKECVRQLRLARDEQERKINQAVSEKTNELDLAKSRLENQLIELQAMVETSRANSPDPELVHKLEFLERENAILRQELESQSEELEVRTIERDLSTKAAETASKQHLDSIKKLAKLEAECRKLKSLSRNDQKSTPVASSYVESLTDSQSDSGSLGASEFDSRRLNGMGSESWASALIAELDQFKGEKVVDRSLNVPSMEIDLMDDFLEMERLASLTDGKPKASEKPVPEAENKLRVELESVIRRTAELEEKIKRVEMEKTELEMALGQTQSCLEKSQVQLIETQMKLEQLDEELRGANEAEQFYKERAISFEREAQSMSSQIKSLEADIDREQALSVEKCERCEELENELEKKREELDIQKDAVFHEELKMKEDALAQSQEHLELSQAQLREAEKKLVETQMKLEQLDEELRGANEAEQFYKERTISFEREAKLMSSQIKSLEADIDRERASSVAKSARCEELENELEKRREELDNQKGVVSQEELKMREDALAQSQERLEMSQAQLREAEKKLQELQNELDEATTEKKSLKSQLDSVRTEVQTMSIQIDSLKEQVNKERALTAELSTTCEDLDFELRRKRQELEVQQRIQTNNELTIKQEDLAAAAGKLADCQKTIASLGTQLKSLATLEDFLIDTASIPGFSPPAPLMARRSREEPWTLHSNHTYLPRKECEPLSNLQEGFSPFASHNSRDSPGSSSSSTSSAFFMNPPGSEKNGNGFAKYFSIARN